MTCPACKQLADVVASSNAQAAALKAQREARVLRIKIKSVYGTAICYPANEAAELIAKISGTKTLNTAQLGYAARLGFQVQEVPAYGLAEVA